MRNFDLKLPKKLFTTTGDQPTVDLEAIMTTIAAENAGGGGPTILTATASLNFAVDEDSYQDLTVTVTGAVVGDVVVLGIPVTCAPASLHTYTAWVHEADTVVVRLNNYGVAPINPPAGTFTIKVFQ